MTSVEKIERIPELRRKGKTAKEIALELGMNRQLVFYWEGRLRREGIDVPRLKPGRQPLKIKKDGSTNNNNRITNQES